MTIFMPTIAEEVRGLVGLARRANKLIIGFDACARAAAKKQAVLILLADDLSLATAARFRKKLEARTVPLLVHGRKAEWGRLLGRDEVGILAVADKGLAVIIAEKLSREQSGKSHQQI